MIQDIDQAIIEEFSTLRAKQLNLSNGNSFIKLCLLSAALRLIVSTAKRSIITLDKYPLSNFKAEIISGDKLFIKVLEEEFLKIDKEKELSESALILIEEIINRKYDSITEEETQGELPEVYLLCRLLIDRSERAPGKAVELVIKDELLMYLRENKNEKY